MHSSDVRDAAGMGSAPAFWTPQEIATLWKVHVNTVVRIFRDEPGVLALATPRRGKRAYVTLRVPQAVFERIARERTTR